MISKLLHSDHICMSLVFCALLLLYPFQLLSIFPNSYYNVNGFKASDNDSIIDNRNLLINKQNNYFENSEYGYSLEYSSDWKFTGDNVFVFEPTSAANDPINSLATLAITTSIVPPGQKMDDITPIVEMYEKEYNAFKLIESSYSNLSGLPAYQMTFTYWMPELGITFTTLQIWTYKEDTNYILSFGSSVDAFSNMLPKFHQISESFRIL